MEKDKEKKTYKFGEKDKEMNLPVWQSPKYLESKNKAIEMIESGKYNLSEGDFWILMNRTKNGDKMAYTGLIISHNGCLKINEAMENKVQPKCFQIDKDGYNGSLVYTYIDEDTYEVGEYNIKNCQNSYPYAMAFKRCFDRVVLKKSKLAFSGIYSEVEADEFKNTNSEETDTKKEQKEDKPFITGEPVATRLTDEAREEYITKIMSYEFKGVDLEKVKEAYEGKAINKFTDKELKDCLGKLEKKYGKQ